MIQISEVADLLRIRGRQDNGGTVVCQNPERLAIEFLKAFPEKLPSVDTKVPFHSFIEKLKRPLAIECRQLAPARSLQEVEEGERDDGENGIGQRPQRPMAKRLGVVYDEAAVVILSHHGNANGLGV